ncbi:neprilysin-4-like [Musca domestica]|uniref:Neprilysin-4 n=1 Tax=Musca domestica TaxID=7370 RepID=A0ABM3V1E9_MUSDO|nr:neprilysin-4 [Musca domestica]XP_058979579.1 neprilysin-4-like [Musca domestica]
MITYNLMCWGLFFYILLNAVRGILTATQTLGDQNRLNKGLEIYRYMNQQVNPCDDFYEFACGNWNTYNSAAAKRKSATGLFHSLREERDQKILLLMNTNDPHDTNVDKKVKNFYKSCMNLPNFKSSYTARLVEIMSEFGQMPAMAGDYWQEQTFDWQATIAAIAHKYGIITITGAEISVDFADNTKNRIYLSEQQLALESRDIYLNPANAGFVKNYINSIANKLYIFLGLDVNVGRQVATEMVQLETNLARGMADSKKINKLADLYTLNTMDEIQQITYPYLNINKLVEESLGTLPDFKVYWSPDYIKNMIRTLQQTPKRVVANYVFYHLIEKFMLVIPQTQPQLQDMCLRQMKTYFSKNFDNMLYRKYNMDDTERGVNAMWQDIKATFIEALKSPHQYAWIRADTRSYAVEKIKAMKMEIVSYKNYDFETVFRPFQVNAHDFVENLQSLFALGTQQKRNAIYLPPQPLDLSERIATTPVNVLIENAVKVPVSILQPNYAWSASFANAFNFGILGALLSHELMHGLDVHGRHHDAQGNSLEWWDPESSRDFNARSQCFNAQYQRYIFHGQHLPDMPAQGENIADNGGVRLAFAAYVKWLEKALATNPRGVNESMPPVNYSDRKLFFISYAQLWCNDITPAFRKYLASVDNHVPDRFRVIGPLSNFDGFAEEFQCPKGSGMNPVQKCEIY